MDSYSGIIIEESRRSEQFSDFTPIPCKGFNLLCKAKRYGRWWVLKGLKKPYRQDGNYKNLLHKEFDILISLQHPNIVSAYSMEEIPEMGTCIVMEWIDGITLEHWSGKKTEGEGIFLQLLDAVHYIHAKQIVHRDLKPSNIIITHNGNHVKLIDFGFQIPMTLPSSNSLPAHRATSHLNRLYPTRQTSATTSSASVVFWKRYFQANPILLSSSAAKLP